MPYCSEELLIDRHLSGVRSLLGRAKGANCRHEYGLRHQHITGQTTCGYCGLDLAAKYEYWLMMALDHVIPASVCKSARIPEEWYEDHANRILCCSACNGFRNRWKPKVDTKCPATPDEFFDLRDAIFTERKAVILESHAKEQEFFDGRLWEL